MKILKPDCRRFKPLSLLARMLAPPMMLILIGCATRPIQPPAPIAPGRIKPLACTDFAPMSFSTGRPGVTVKEIQDDLARTDDPLGWGRADLGDTMTTRAEIDAYKAARKVLGCE